MPDKGGLKDGCPSPLPTPGCTVEVEVTNDEAMLHLLQCIQRLLDAAQELIVIKCGKPKLSATKTRPKAPKPLVKR